jgi:hypothetical protein
LKSDGNLLSANAPRFNRHHPREYSEASVIESKGRGVLDTPLARAMRSLWSRAKLIIGSRFARPGTTSSENALPRRRFAGEHIHPPSGSSRGDALVFCETGQKKPAYQGEIT